MRVAIRLRAIALVMAIIPGISAGQPAPCEVTVARAVSVQGRVESRAGGAATWSLVQRNDRFCPGDRIRVLANSRAALELSNETILRLDHQTSIVLGEVDATGSSLLDLLEGIGHFLSRVPRALKIKTPYVNAAVEGTEFYVGAGGNEGRVGVFEGTVRAFNEQGTLLLTDGQTAVARQAQAPVLRLDLRPEDAVRWSLYYPALFKPETAGAEEIKRAAELLAVGRVDAAAALLDAVLAASAQDSQALALKSIIALAQNRNAEALALAEQAVASDSKGAAAHLALSYARQARFDLAGARSAADAAVAVAAQNALAWARLAELHAALDDSNRALAAAQKAVALDPQSARAQTVLGFTYLTRIDLDAAAQAFEGAIAFGQSDPLPWLGLGLAKIRQGRVAEGRRDIEIAASLDQNNAIVRSYLGKAYYEEKRNALAAVQFALAKQADPLDPTAWFYDAIRKQTENRPDAALADLEKSIALNGNRAVYRSTLQLDQDEAARTASLARIHNDLGFQSRALLEGWRAVTADPRSHGAHRFLADSYAARTGTEIARVSSLLQAQMLQPLSRTPLQPQLAESNLAILDGAGPSTPAFNEFNPLFTRNGVGVQFNAVGGSNNTAGNDLVVSGIQDKLAFSVGQFHYESDGFRPNNDLEHDIYNALFQAELSPRASVQLEWRSRETENGDLNLRFDPDNFSRVDRRRIDVDQLRLGARLRPTPNSDLLFSVIGQSGTDRSDTLAEGFEVGGELDSDSRGAELQYLARLGAHDLIVGIGHFNQDGTTELRTLEVSLDILGFGPDGSPIVVPVLTPASARMDADIQHDNAYVYSIMRPVPAMSWIAGLSYDDFDDADLRRRQLNPKLGLVWDVSPDTTLRAAAFRTLKRPFLGNQTLESVQIAGFNQLFDDVNGSDSERYGIGLDHRFSEGLFGGVELSWREIQVPSVPQSEQQDEQSHRAYLNWLPAPRWAASAGLEFDSFERSVLRADVPNDLRSYILPLRLSWFPNQRLFTTVRASYVRQRVETAQASLLDPDDVSIFKDRDAFWVVDAEVGIRLPNRRGKASILVKNLLDTEFQFQDRNFQTTEPRTPRFIPERAVFVNLNLAF